jgi:hypothetical protein
MTKRRSVNKIDPTHAAAMDVPRSGGIGPVWWLLPLLWLVTLAVYHPAWYGGML